MDMDVRDREKQPDVALVVVIDKSGSMDACHCNTFDRDRGVAIQGVTKVDIGKEAILRAASALTERDELGVVAFDEDAHWVVQTAPLGGVGDLEGAHRGHPAGRPDQHHRGPDTGRAVARGRQADPPPHRPADRRLVDQRRVRRDPRADEGGGHHALDGRRGRRRRTRSWSSSRERGGGRFYAAAEPGVDPGHLPQGDAAGLGAADRRGDVLPDPDLPLADPAGHRGRLPPAARLQRHDRQARRADGARHRARRSAARPVAVRPRAVGGVDLRRDRAMGARLDRLGRLRAVLRQMVAWTFPGEESDGIEATFVDRGGRTFLRVESVDPDGSPRDFYSTRWRSSAPTSSRSTVDLSQVAPGVYEAPVNVARAAPTRCA